MEKPTSKMNPEIKKHWVEKLRSGEYAQGQHYLRRGDTYCCLGVLTDMYLKAHNIEWDECFRKDPAFDDLTTYAAFGNYQEAPEQVSEWAGLEGQNIEVFVIEVFVKAVNKYSDPQRIPITTVNDCGTTFKEIADIIEEQL